MPSTVIVRAPSRLHFGLFALASSAGRQFGGVGAMVDEPGSELRLEPADEFEAPGPLSARIARSADAWRRFHGRPLPKCRVIVGHAPPEHVGLGVGTQLGLSVAAGLSAYSGLAASAPAELALSAGRGLRSAVGTYGFVMGGLIVEQGKLPGEPISPLDTRVDLPAAWRFLLVRPLDAAGLCGAAEEAAMDSIDVPPETTGTLIREVREHLIPAAATADFEAFAGSVSRYCSLAGSFYSALQGGPYNGPVLTALVEQIRSWGHAGIGQSSWGPTLFVAQASAASAAALAEQLRRQWQGPPLDLTIARPNQRGALVERVPLIPEGATRTAAASGA